MLLAVVCCATAMMAAAADYTVDHAAYTGVSRAKELARRSYALGQTVNEHLPAGTTSLKLDCGTAERCARTIHTPPHKVSVHLVAGNGEHTTVSRLSLVSRRDHSSSRTVVQSN